MHVTREGICASFIKSSISLSKSLDLIVEKYFASSVAPLITGANANEVYRALANVDFLVVTDFFMTPTAELADIALPAATWLEMDDIGDTWKRNGYVFPRKKILQIGE